MSILIPGMKMPKAKKHGGVMLTNCCFSVNTKGEKSLYIPNEDGSATKYPLIELPSHGDLIDRDALMKHKGDCYDTDGHLLYAVGTGNILCAPTIIEAEGEG